MTEQLITDIAKNLKIKPQIVEKVIELLAAGNTVHFLARYRKEQIGGVDEEVIREIDKTYQYQQNLAERKIVITQRIDEQGMLTDEVKAAIEASDKLTQLEQIYEPYKSKKITKAKLAIQGGLEPLAKLILAQESRDDLLNLAAQYINETFPTSDDVIENVQYLVAQFISENMELREAIKRHHYKVGIIETKIKKKGTELDENQTYQNYYEFSKAIQRLANHQVLAINRAEKEKILQVKLVVDEEHVLEFMAENVLQPQCSVSFKDCLIIVMQDALKRLILPSVQREVRSELTGTAQKEAITLFGKNVYQLLMQKPLVKQTVLGFDPAFRTGCKLAIIDAAGDVEAIDVIYPHEPKKQWDEAKRMLTKLYQKHNFSIIAIGNGTASRESEAFVAEWIQESQENIQYAIVSEAGASVYSASKVAIAEFPTYSVEQRSAVSIARRLLDPLSELVKIDPKSLGVGQYQHDLNEKELNDELTFVVDQAVNTVGVDVNIASSELLQYVSGLNKKTAGNIVMTRSELGMFTSRKDLKKIKGLGAKSFEQAAGFLRIVKGKDTLDNTNIHPESYKIALQVLKLLQCEPTDIGMDKIRTAITEKPIQAAELATDKYTLQAILEAFAHPLRDERDKFSAPQLRSGVTTLDDLNIGMELEGVVRNITDFGAFIDIGLKNDGFVHISKIASRFLSHPSDALSIGDIKTVYIENIYPERNKVELTLISPSK